MSSDFPAVGYYVFASLDEGRFMCVVVRDIPAVRKFAAELIDGWTCHQAIANELARAVSAPKPDRCDQTVWEYAVQSFGLALMMLGAPPFLLFNVKDGTVQEARHIPAETAFEADAFVRRLLGLPDEKSA